VREGVRDGDGERVSWGWGESERERGPRGSKTFASFL